MYKCSYQENLADRPNFFAALYIKINDISMNIYTIIVSAGKGKRIGKNIPKGFLEIKGKPLLFYSIEKFKIFSSIIIVIPKDYLKVLGKKLKVEYPDIDMKIVSGGEKRQDSVLNGLEIIKNKEGIVLIHDVARPFVSRNLIEKVIDGTKKYGACIPVLKVSDTVKKVKKNIVEETIDRNKIFFAQTPQGFNVNIIKKAYEKGKKEKFIGTDDASFVERMGITVHCIQGERTNLKITYPEDIIIGETISKYLNEKDEK